MKQAYNDDNLLVRFWTTVQCMQRWLDRSTLYSSTVHGIRTLFHNSVQRCDILILLL